MKISHPSQERFNFILCEDIRQEVGNKLTFLGVYTGGDILFPKGTKEMVLPSLTLFFGFGDGEGEFGVRIKLTGPDGSIIVEKELERAIKKPREGMNLIFGFKPFHVKEFGTYAIAVYLDGEPYERTFDIKEVGQKELAPKAATH